MMSIPAGRDRTSSNLVADSHERRLPTSESFEDYLARAQDAFTTDQPFSLEPPPSLRRRRSDTPDWLHAAHELAPDHGLLDDSQSEFDAIGRTPSPDARESSVPPVDFQSRRQTFGFFKQRSVAPAFEPHGFIAAEPATYGTYGYRAPSRPRPTELPSAPVTSHAPESSSSHPPVGIPARQRAHDDPNSHQPYARHKYQAQLRPMQSMRRPIAYEVEDGSAATSSASTKKRRTQTEPSGPLRRSARIGRQSSRSTRAGGE
ncbi:hypothetical protein C8Q80DRAFT_262733 [Daedaleopsis nitida]|nr:hypothetical protein C8Q80DRAFT_262733 [Daedaleopsis nitida]